MKKFVVMFVLALTACSSGPHDYRWGDEYTRADIDHNRALTRAEYNASEFGPTLGDRGWKDMDIDGSGDISPMEYRRYPNQNRNN